MDLDQYLGVHAQSLLLAARRNDVLASNLANADTPGFKARDLDFKAAMHALGNPSQGQLGMSATQPGHLGTSAASATGADASLKYRVPLAPSLDGNTVDSQLEQAAFAENVVRYQASLSLINGRLRSLMTAITGQ